MNTLAQGKGNLITRMPKFFPTVSILPDIIVHAQNIYRLIKPDRFGLSLVDFCFRLDEGLRKIYSVKELFDVYNSDLRNNGDGVLIKIVVRPHETLSHVSRLISETTFISKYPLCTKLMVQVAYEEVGGDFIVGDLLGDHINTFLREVSSVPLTMCLSRASNISNTYTVYAHTFTNLDNFFGAKSPAEPSYIGVTNRGWVVRWLEHVAAAKVGSSYRFHEGIRRFYQANPVFHEVIGCGLDHDNAMKAEEYIVDHFSLYPKGFNMIPGGEAGIRYLGSKGFPKTDWEHREKTIQDLVSSNARKGIANPLMMAYWQNDDYASSIICSNPNNFNKKQVEQIRFMAEIGKTVEEIAVTFGCPVARIRKLLCGDTYSRVT